MNASIAGIGTSVPPFVALQTETSQYHAELSLLDATHSRMLRALYRRSGVRSRGSVLLERADGPLSRRQSFYPVATTEDDPGPGTAARMARYEAFAPALGLEAARNALADAGTDAGEITHLVTVSCTGFMSPGLDSHLIDTLGMGRGVERTHVGFMGCHAALNGLRVAKGFVEADPDAVALVCAVELCSLHFAYGWHPDSLVANALFADGAASAVCRRTQGNGASPPWRLAATATHLFPDSGSEMTWRIGDHGYRMTLSARVPEIIRGGLGEWMQSWLAGHGLQIEDISSWAIHPGGPRIVDAAEEALELDADLTAGSREVLAAHGNMSSATILFILAELRKRNAPLPCVALAFGPGLALECILLS